MPRTRPPATAGPGPGCPGPSPRGDGRLGPRPAGEGTPRDAASPRPADGARRAAWRGRAPAAPALADHSPVGAAGRARLSALRRGDPGCSPRTPPPPGRETPGPAAPAP